MISLPIKELPLKDHQAIFEYFQTLDSKTLSRALIMLVEDIQKDSFEDTEFVIQSLERVFSHLPD